MSAIAEEAIIIIKESRLADHGRVFNCYCFKDLEMNQRNFKLSTLTALVFVFGLLLNSSCNKTDDPPNNTGNNAQMTLRLTDGPASYDALWLDVQQVVIISDAGASTTLIPARPGLYNLLALRNGIDTLLVTAPVPAGTISQIRLVLGSNNSIVVNGNSYPLNTPSAQESGLKLNLHETLQAGGSYTFWLDFDVAKSIIQTGNGQYKLKPVIRAYTSLTNGKITGYVLPLASLTTVYAINAADTFSAIPAANGYFQIGGLPAGTYQVVYDATATGFVDVAVNNVQVSFGAATDLGVRTMGP
jgi:hypothetical protein